MTFYYLLQISLIVSFPPSQPTLSHFIYSSANSTACCQFPFVCAQGCVCISIRKPEVRIVCLPQLLSHLYFWYKISHEIQSSLVAYAGWIASLRDPSASTSPVAGITDGVGSSDLFMWYWRFELRFSRLRGKHFTNGAIFPALSIVP